MKKHIAIITLVSVMMVCLLSSCGIITGGDTGDKTPVPAPTPVPKIGPEEPEPCSILEVRGVSVNVDEDISFRGCSTLPDGTYLQTQLYSRYQPRTYNPEVWWPADKYIQVQDGEWQITVPLGEEATNLYIGSETIFLFKVWKKDNPSVIAGYMFELMGPPAASELEP